MEEATAQTPIDEKYISIEQHYEFLVFLKKEEEENISRFMEDRYMDVDFYYFFSDIKKSFLISTTLLKIEFEFFFKKYVKDFKILEEDVPTLDELLEKISNKGVLSLREKSIMCRYSMPELFENSKECEKEIAKGLLESRNEE